jgi:hypothetical protein
MSNREYVQAIEAVSWLAFGNFSELWKVLGTENSELKSKTSEAEKLLIEALRAERISVWGKKSITDKEFEVVPLTYLLNQDVGFDFEKNELGRFLPEPLRSIFGHRNDWKQLRIKSSDVKQLKSPQASSRKIPELYLEAAALEAGRQWMREEMAKGPGNGGRAKFRKFIKEKFGRGQKEAVAIFSMLIKEIGGGPGKKIFGQEKSNS